MKAFVNLGKALLTLGILVYFLYLFANNWASLSFQGMVFKSSWVSSILFFSTSTLLSGLLWRNLLEAISETHTFPLSAALHLHSVAWLYRYVPGKIAHVAYRVSAPQKFGFSGKEAFAAFLYETVFATLASLTLAVPILIVFGLTDVNVLWSIAGFASILAVIFFLLWLSNQPFISRSNLRLKKFVGPEEGSLVLPWPLALRGVSLHFFPRLFMASGCSVLVLSSAQSDWEDVYLAGAVFLFATVVGLMVPFAPSGLGVREGVIIAMLTPVLGFAEAVELSALTRVLTVSSDLMVFLTTFSLRLIVKRR
jgi:hypothetical protein